MFLIDTIPAFYYHRASPDKTCADPRGLRFGGPWSVAERLAAPPCGLVRRTRASFIFASDNAKGSSEASPEGIMMLSRKVSPLEPEGILFHEDNFLIAAALDHYAGEHPKKNTST